MIIASFDPGKLTGYVVAEIAHDGTAWVVDTVRSWQEMTQAETYFEVFTAGLEWDLMVCESFIPRGGALKFQPYSLELIGYLKGHSANHGIPIKFQAPIIKNVFHKEALTSWPKVGRGGGGHARDAMAHLIGYVSNNLTNKK